MMNTDHQTMSTLINALSGVAMLLGAYAFYLCVVYDRRAFYAPLRRKR